MISLTVIVFLWSICSSEPISNVEYKEGKNGDYSITIRMPNAVSDRPDALICTAVKLSHEEAYLIRFKPHAKKETAHHMMVYGCDIPGNTAPTWDCSSGDGIGENALCGNKNRQILFAWAMDAPDKDLPEGVGIRVSGTTQINYFVLQLHYTSAFPPGMTDNSGITLEITEQRPEQLANYLVMGTWGTVPPQQKAFYLETSCEYNQNFTIYPIGYRTHSHKLGYVTSGYRIRDGKWTEIGRMSPQLPQTFYPVSNPGMDIRRGDILVARCTMNSMARTNNTVMGPTNHDEMCNFYIMYSTFHMQQEETTYCFQDADTYNWAVDENVNLTGFPPDVSSLNGIPGAQIVEDFFNGLPSSHQST